MKTGTENKTKTRIAIVLAIIAVITVAWTLMPSGTPASHPAPIAAAPAKGIPAPSSESIDPRLHMDLLASSEEVKYEGKGKNIFRIDDQISIPRAAVSPLLARQRQARNVYIPPPPPPITLKFFGLTSAKGEKPKAFLSQGDDVWIAHEGDVVNRHYKIVRISPNAVEVEDLLNNNRQSIPITQG